MKKIKTSLDLIWFLLKLYFCPEKTPKNRGFSPKIKKTTTFLMIKATGFNYSHMKQKDVVAQSKDI